MWKKTWAEMEKADLRILNLAKEMTKEHNK